MGALQICPQMMARLGQLRAEVGPAAWFHGCSLQAPGRAHGRDGLGTAAAGGASGVVPHAEEAGAWVPEASPTKGQPEASSRLRGGLMPGLCGDPRTSHGVGVGRTPWHFWAAWTAAWVLAGAVSSQSPQMSEGDPGWLGIRTGRVCHLAVGPFKCPRFPRCLL